VAVIQQGHDLLTYGLLPLATCEITYVVDFARGHGLPI
jgi:hypothetical protein